MCDNHHCSCHSCSHTEEHHHEGHRQTILLAVSSLLLFLGLGFEYFDIKWFSGFSKVAWYFLSWVLVAFPIVKELIEEAKNGSFFNEFSLMTIASLGAFFIGEYSEGVAVLVLYTLGEILQAMAVGRSRRSIKSLLDMRPQLAWVKRGEEWIQEKPEDVEVGDLVLVKVGDRVAIDGIMESVKSSFDTSALTGESQPRTIVAGQEVLAGMVNMEFACNIKAIRRAEDSSLSRILQMTEVALERKSKSELFIRRFAKVYTPIVFLLAIAITFLPVIFLKEYVFSEWLYRGLIFLVISCPCALVISVPLGYFSGIGLAAKNGILLKGASFLDTLLQIKTIFFDKTGTLTKASFEVVELESKIPQDEFLSLLANIESHSTHPIAKAILRFVEKNNVRVSEEVFAIQEVAGKGLVATNTNASILVGSGKLLNERNISYPESLDVEDNTTIFLARNGELLGYLKVADELRDEAKKVVGELLGKQKINCVVLSGDSKNIVQSVSEELGIGVYYGGLLPEDKLKIVNTEKRYSIVAFVGDGINDSPALAASDLSITLGGVSSQSAIEISDIVIQNDSLSSIPKAIRIAKLTNRLILANVWFILLSKVSIMLLAILGVASLWLAIFADVGVAMLSILFATSLFFRRP